MSNKNYILVYILCFSVLAQFVALVVYYGQVYHLDRVDQYQGVIQTELAVNCARVLNDMLLAGVMIWLLRKARSGLKRTNSIVNRLVVYIISSGLVTCIASIIALISAEVAPGSFIYMIPMMVMPKREYFAPQRQNAECANVKFAS